MTKKKRILFGFTLALLTLFFCLFAVEAGLRIFLPAPLFHNIDITSYGAQYLLSDNPKLIYVPKPNAGEYNQYGHRGRVWPEAPEKRPRFVFLGDSVTEGYNVELNQRFTHLLNEKFQGRGEMVNLAVRGYDLRQEMEYFKEKALAFSPDYLIWCITYNDLVMWSGEVQNIQKLMKENKKSGFYLRFYTMKGALARFLLRFQIYRYALYLASSQQEENFFQAMKYTVGEEEVLDILKELRQLEKQQGFETVFVFHPSNTPLFRKEMFELWKTVAKKGFLNVSLESFANEKMTPEEKQALFLPKDPCHFNPEGHIYVAGQLEGLIPQFAYTLAQLNIKKEKNEKALVHISHALELSGGAARIHNERGLLLMKMGRRDEARKDLLVAVDKSPGTVAPYYNLACLHSLENQPKQAAAWLNKAVERGFRDLATAEGDPDLQNLRKSVFWEEVRRSIVQARTTQPTMPAAPANGS